MKKIAIFAPVLPDETAGTNAPPQAGERLAGEPPSPGPAPAVPAPASATGRRADQQAVSPPAQPSSVVTKVAKLLLCRNHCPQSEPPAQWADGYVQQKVLMSLQAKQPL